MSSSADKPSNACRAAVEILIQQHSGSFALYQSANGGVVIVVDEPESREIILGMIQAGASFVSSAPGPEVPEA